MTGTIPALRVKARPEGGFRRAGVHWPHEGLVIAADAFTPEQINTLLAEPQLIVEHMSVASDTEPQAEPGTPAARPEPVTSPKRSR